MEEPSCSSRVHKSNMERKMSAMACTIFNELRLEGKLCDVVIKVNGIEFNAHKNILCGCSSYFRALFTSGWNNTEKRVYSIPGVSPDMMKLIIEYAYTRTVPVTVDNVERLLAAADQFNVLGIVRACCEFLETQLCLENCIGICKFADYYYCPELRHMAYMFILHNFEEMIKVSQEFLELSAFEFRDIIEKDELNVKQEDVVFDAILKWITHDTNNRRKYISILLPKVRLALMNAEYFMNNVKNNDYVKENEDCKPVIINALKAMYDLNMNGPSNSDFKNPLTRPRLPYAILFAIGGWSGGSPTNAIEAYDARADRWVNVTCEEESPRAYHGAAYLKGYMYIIGGFDSVDYFNSVKRFDPVKKTWHQVAPMHSRRCYVSVTVLNNFIYAMGGFDGYVRLNTAERYEPETNQWTLISPMHEQRSDASATTLHGKVYICGGFNGNECLFTAECYSPETNQWTMIAPMRSRRSGVGVIAYGEHVYAVGGFDGANRLRSAEGYSPLTNTWRNIPTMFNPRSNFGIEVVDDLMFVVGGFNGFTTTFNVECYDEKTDEWYDAHDMSIYRSALSCCIVPGLSNVRDYAAPRNNFLGQSTRDEVKYTMSTSILPL
ncbi:kelch-like protein 10 [Latimeria chalumnae]|uniref:Kelch like family member 10 n=1 Tax=Latimeria chalumnae TaxID=7897 RepID=H2ZWD1_LATCH|nr:PREDICTED: kelch-like protein 10 [Latimeria chalumnae]|eukprot:XP_006004318.1 PREDICTED: kelch-like protein 10 [Latimeria chalumnae]